MATKSTKCTERSEAFLCLLSNKVVSFSFLTQVFQAQEGQVGDAELQSGGHDGLALFADTVVIGFGTR
jgi:hypothetical protein